MYKNKTLNKNNRNKKMAEWKFGAQPKKVPPRTVSSREDRFEASKKSKGVNISSFDKDALEQLKKTFGPSLESQFEAKKVGGDKMDGKGGDGGWGTSFKGAFGKGGAWKILAGVLGFAAVAVVGLTQGLMQFVKDVKGLIKWLGETKIGAWFKQKWQNTIKRMKAPFIKLGQIFRESSIVKWISTSWDETLKAIKENKVIKGGRGQALAHPLLLLRDSPPFS